MYADGQDGLPAPEPQLRAPARRGLHGRRRACSAGIKHHPAGGRLPHRFRQVLVVASHFGAAQQWCQGLALRASNTVGVSEQISLKPGGRINLWERARRFWCLMLAVALDVKL